MIDNPKLLHCVQRIRVRSEFVLGLTAQLRDDLTAMNRLPDPNPEMVIDSSFLFPFDGVDWLTLKGLFSQIIALTEVPEVEAILKQAQVRPLDYILRTMPDRFYSFDYQGNDPYVLIFYSRIRPRAMSIRSLRYTLNDDKRVIGRVLSLPEIVGLNDTEEINEYRSDVPPLTVGIVRGFYAVVNQVIGGPIDSEEVSQAIDDACGGEELVVR